MEVLTKSVGVLKASQGFAPIVRRAVSASAGRRIVGGVRHISTVPQIIASMEDHGREYNPELVKEQVKDQVRAKIHEVPAPKLRVVTAIPSSLKEMNYEAAAKVLKKDGLAGILNKAFIDEHTKVLAAELKSLEKSGHHDAARIAKALRMFAKGDIDVIYFLDSLPTFNFTDVDVTKLGPIPVTSPVVTETKPVIKLDRADVSIEETKRAAACFMPSALFTLATIYGATGQLPAPEVPIFCIRGVKDEGVHSTGAEYGAGGSYGLIAIQADGSIRTALINPEQIIALLTEEELKLLQLPVFYVANRLYNFEGDGTKTFPVLSRGQDGRWVFRYSDGLLISHTHGLDAEQVCKLALLIEKINYMGEELLAFGKAANIGIREAQMATFTNTGITMRKHTGSKDGFNHKGVDEDDSHHPTRRVMLVRTEGVQKLDASNGKKSEGISK